MKDGHSVAKASNGIEAIELLSKEPSFDLLITALDMPFMDGVELAKTLKEEYNYSVPVIILMDMDTEQQRKLEFTDVACFLSKPFTENLLSKKIDEINRENPLSWR
ncbi:MAG: response regulator [Nitrospirae bacterium]|nr:MAG: response regulator [Nitrospirota bacterium]